MIKHSGLLFITFLVFVASSSGIKAQPPFSEEFPLLAKPYNESTFIDIREDRKPDLFLQKETKPKSFYNEFDDFLRDTENAYAGIWVFRASYIRDTDQIIVDPKRWWKNISHFQNGHFKGNNRRGPITWYDGDKFRTNWIQHPAFGAAIYLYYRTRGYDRPTAAFGSFLQSTLFEYTVEGILRPPSFHDLIVTPGAGVPLGIILEETSNWLEGRQSGFLRALSYVINPTKIFFRGDSNKVNLGPLMNQYVLIGFDW